MSDTKVNVEVVCERHPTEKLGVVSEDGGNFYEFRLRVTSCDKCIADAVTSIDTEELPAKSVEFVFNESNFTSRTVSV